MKKKVLRERRKAAEVKVVEEVKEVKPKRRASKKKEA